MSTFEDKNKSEAAKVSTSLVRSGDESAIIKAAGVAKGAEDSLKDVDSFAKDVARVADEKAREVEDMKSGRRDNSTGMTIAKLKNAVAGLGGADANRLMGLIDAMERDGVTEEELMEVIQKTVILLVGAVDAFGDDISNAHQKIAYNKTRLTGIASTVSKLSNLVTKQFTRINAVLIARGLDPQDSIMENIRRGAIYFGDNNHRRLDIVTWLISMVTTKAMRLYQPVPDQEWYKTLFVRNSDPIKVCVNVIAAKGGEVVPANHTFILMSQNGQGFAGDRVEAGGTLVKGSVYLDFCEPYLAPSLGAFAKVLLAGWLSGRFESPLGLLATFATQSLGNFADGGKAGDLDLGL